MSVVDEAVQDGVSQGGISNGFMPVLNRELARDDGRTTAVAIFEDFQQIASLRWGEDGQTPVIEDLARFTSEAPRSIVRSGLACCA